MLTSSRLFCQERRTTSGFFFKYIFEAMYFVSKSTRNTAIPHYGLVFKTVVGTNSFPTVHHKRFLSGSSLSSAHVSLVVFFGLGLGLENAGVKQKEAHGQATGRKRGVDRKGKPGLNAENIKAAS